VKPLDTAVPTHCYHRATVVTETVDDFETLGAPVESY
jgi:hypothetical protein